ncbi:MAG: arylsulfatase [Opitutaceae bacterium]|nr:arylsulfatase [Opitutaceae bacterium]
MPLARIPEAIISLLLTLLSFVACANGRPPNIVFIVADDLGYGDIGPYGQSKIRTPSLDHMAAEGLRFTQHYAGNAVCAPSRCVLMTGLHPGHAFIRDNRKMPGATPTDIGRPEVEGQYPIPDSTFTLAEALKSAGYRTGGFGKWGLGGPGSVGDPLRQGFDRWYGYNCQAVAHNYYPTYLWDNASAIDLPNPPFSSQDRLGPTENPLTPASYARFKGTAYSADLIAEKALEFVRENKARPFFLYWATTVPHVPLQVPDDSLREYLGLWNDPPYPGGKGYLPAFAPKAAYAAMITRMDREIGRMMTLISELGLDQDTVFVFVSDNGPLNGTHQGLAGTDCAFFNSNGGLRDGKGTLYEGGIRVPCIVRWKGTITSGTSQRVTGFEDWMPTLLDLAGAPGQMPRGLDGISFAPTLLGARQPERDFLYREFTGYSGQQSIRVGDWKAIRRNLQRKAKPNLQFELYNLATDRAESRDVADTHPVIVTKMAALIAAQHASSAEFPFPVLDKDEK